MSLSTQPYKGARDFYPEDKRTQKYMFAKIRGVVESFGYHEYDAPILEPLDLYLAKTGEEIVNEQLYSFEDKGGRKVAIRPEMTPTASRMVAARRQELAYPLRWYSLPNLWRYERPQRGRLREHWQLNVDIFGVPGVEADHEIILVASSVLKSFGAPTGSYTIRVSSRKLLEHFLTNILGLQGRLVLDAMKLMDRKHKMPRDKFEEEAQELLADETRVKDLMEFLHCAELNALPASVKDHPSVTELEKLMKLLADSGVTEAVFDTSIVRGMDYYTDIVFEVFDADPENIRSMFGGGRYDGLVGLFGVEPVPTVGFGMGDVTLLNFLETHNLLPQLPPEADVVAILVGDVYGPAQDILSHLRLSNVNIAVDSSGRKLDMQLKHAIKSGARYALFIGEAELASGNFKLRDLKQGEEKELKLDQVVEALKITR
jgi:histidyl-tRNA synthetase